MARANRGTGVVRVLIVDDDARVRSALSSFLNAHTAFAVVAAAGDAATALDIARQHAPDVALVDMHLPREQDGIGLLRDLIGLGIPVVAISLDPSARSCALAAGAHRFLDKSAASDQILEALAVAAR